MDTELSFIRGKDDGNHKRPGKCQFELTPKTVNCRNQGQSSIRRVWHKATVRAATATYDHRISMQSVSYSILTIIDPQPQYSDLLSIALNMQCSGWDGVNTSS
jgi:hypothetical protein